MYTDDPFGAAQVASRGAIFVTLRPTRLARDDGPMKYASPNAHGYSWQR